MRIDEFDWSQLIILDACRHDLYEEVNGKTRQRRTVASSSEGFIHRTFNPEYSDTDWSDTVVITANPHYHPPLFEEQTGKKPSDVFKDVYNLFADENYWNEEAGTVKPGKVVEAVKKAVDKHGNSQKFLIHFMQPHAPFLDSDIENNPDRDMNVWELMREGEYNDMEMWTAFKNNLEKVMPSVRDVNQLTTGKTVVTADHGNAFGENNIYGHPQNRTHPVLRTVPYHILPSPYNRGDTILV